jgi:type VI secretion system secreted protein VgrG
MLEGLTGREELSQPFSYELTLLSEDNAIKANTLLGKSVTVELDLLNDSVRCFNGIVTRFARGATEGRFAHYHATMRPWLWILSRSTDCRIFQNMKVPDVVMQVFRDFGFTDFDDALSGSYRTWDYLVQYRESALDFVSRLLEHEGIYYYFKHESGKHTLVLADGYAAHEAAPGYAEVPFFPPAPESVRERDHLSAWNVSEQVQPGAYTLNDFDFTRPRASLQARTHDPRDHAHADLEQYDYPGAYVEAAHGEAYSKVRLHALLAQYERNQGQGDARGLAAGNLFKLAQHPHAELNREYLIIAAEHTVKNSTRESNTQSEVRVDAAIAAIESRVPYRAPQRTPKPTIHGPQTAIVVGKAGEEIWTDQYGRVKVQFHWDRLGKRDENSSCWVRVAQVWAGATWGAIHIPRIGQEVIVEFLEGDPDRPIITGHVYNDDNKPPYTLPANQTQSGIKSRSSQGGNPDNANELRFEDKKGAEEVYLQAEKNLTELVKNDHATTVQGSQTNSVSKSQSESVGADQSLSVEGNRTKHVKGSESVTIDGSAAADGVSGGKLNITGDYQLDTSNTIAIQAPTSIKLQCGASSLLIEPGKITLSAGGGATVVLDANAFIRAAGAAQALFDANAALSSAAGSTLVLDANAAASASGGGQVFLDANVLAAASGGGQVVLDANVFASASGGGALTLDANALLSGAEATVAGESAAQLDASGNVKAEPSGVTINGTMVKIN